MIKCLNFQEFRKGILRENPVLKLVLGTCPTLAITTSASNSLGMGIAATLVLVFSNATISYLRNWIPDRIRIPSYITLIAGFVTVIHMIIKAYFPRIDHTLGIYLPLITVNCIILGRAEMYARKHSVQASILDGLGMGIGFTLSLFLIGMIREILGTGSLFGIRIIPEDFDSILFFLLPPGGFFVFGIVIAIVRWFSKIKGNKMEASCIGCCSKCGVSSGKKEF